MSRRDPAPRRATLSGDEIAIVGMAGRFPGSADVDAFWRHLLEGREGIVALDDARLRAAGATAREIAHPRYVKAAPLLAGHDRFDAAFFGYSPLEAEVMDPQQRLLLEVAWQALEDAGHDPARGGDAIGVFAGSKTNTYLFHLASKPEVLRQRDALQLILGGDQALLATRISYKLDLRGPSYAVQTACSSSLVAVHLACRSLLLDECRMALAGGVALNVPHEVGYRYDEGGILSPDGHCRPFDADAAGTVFGSGVGMVVLKRLADAEADGDTVRALILGSATNNDGSGKATFTAPSVEGQTGVILEALADAGVDADSIGYVEAHGTGTRLGDPIEVLALTHAYRASTDRRGFCALGSVKGNVGHLDAAAGMPALVKAVRALQTGEVPATLHYRAPNPAIDLADSPFFVAGERLPLAGRDGLPRRAGVSSLGFGGTNAHLVLEQAPPAAAGEAANRDEQLLVLSARDPQALDAAAERLAERLEAGTEPHAEPHDGPHDGPQDGPVADAGAALADVAWTLQTGRRAFDHRRAVVAADRRQAVERLRGSGSAVEGRRGEQPRALYLFPGQGAQYAGMGRGLYAGEAIYRREIDRAAEALAPRLGFDLRELLAPPAGGEAAAAERLRHTAATQPALLAVEHALARQWMEWGLLPAAMIGHSVGEYTAAVLAGVVAFEDALALVAERGRLMGELPAGAMAAVTLAADEVEPLLAGDEDDPGDDGVELAAANAPRRSVVSGGESAVAAFEARLRAAHGDGVRLRRLHTSHAFHSRRMEPILDAFRGAVEAVELAPPRIPFVSNLTGTWIRDDEATDPGYWVRHLRAPVRFAAGLATLLAGDGAPVLVEVGPGTVLATFAREVAAEGERGGDGGGEGGTAVTVVPSLRHPDDRRSDGDLLLASLGRAWAAGLEPDWAAVHGGRRRRRVPLPAYPFDVTGRRHWIELGPAGAVGETASAEVAGAAAGGGAVASPQLAAERLEAPARVTLERLPEPEDWLYRPAWQPAPLGTGTEGAAADVEPGERWLVFVADGAGGLGAAVAARLRGAGARVVTVEPGAGWERLDEERFRLAVASREDHDRLLSTLAAAGRLPRRIAHLWSAEPLAGESGVESAAQRSAAQDLGFGSVLALAQALARREASAELTVVTAGAAALGDSHGDAAGLVPERALVLGPVKVLPKEHPEISSRAVDLDPREVTVALRELPEDGPATADGDAASGRPLLEALLADLSAPSTEPLVAWRGGERFAERFERLGDALAANATGDSAAAGGGEPAAGTAPAPRLKPDGVYLVTGGLGGVGSVIAGHLADAVAAKLVLTGRRELPPAESWDDLLAAAPGGAQDGGSGPGADSELRRRVARVRELEARGAEVMVVAADVTDEAAMAAAVAAARQRFGRIDGVVHAAGIAGGGLLQLKTRPAAAAVLAGKVAGTRVLQRLFDAPGAEPLDFLLLVSSLQSVMADFGQVDYAGANAFLDAFAARRRASGRATLAVDFDNWREVGILVEVGLPPHLEPWREELLGMALANDEAVAVLARLLAGGAALPRVVVSTQELAPRIELSRRLTRHQVLRQLGPAAGGGAVAATAAAGLAGVSAAQLTRRLQAVWRRVLDLGDFDPAANFFDLGGDSLTGMQLVAEINRELGVELSPVDLYDTPSVAALVARLAPAGEPEEPTTPARTAVGPEPVEGRHGALPDSPPAAARHPGAIAIVGMAGRFPGAAGVDELWRALRAGEEAVRFFRDDELLAAGVPAADLADPNYVRARPVLDGVDLFDAAFFGFSPRDARILDPQHRLFLEHCWQALEDAGYDPARIGAPVGVFAGSSISSYLRLLWSEPDFASSVGEFQALIGNEKDSLTTHVSYKLDLRGPSVAVQSFCSTSLVAVHTACRSLLDGDCEMALAGGVSIHLPQQAGYRYDPSGGVSRDGHLRAFDASASGYVFGNGVGVVVLKPLDRALADGDTVRAVILGSAVNNDGSMKVGYTATAVDGQAAVIRRALDAAGVDPASVGYVECHGSGTPLGDPVEIAALNRAYGNGGGRAACPVGSVKTNLGHLDRAAGVAGLIKAVLTLERGEIPPSLHFVDPNPNIDFDGGPFYVNTELRGWPRPAGGRRRASVNSLGLGGTNAHLVLEEAPEPLAEPTAARPPRRHQLVVVSARSGDALEAASANLAAALDGRSAEALADAAWTLQAGRRAFEHRRAVVAADAAEAVAALAGERRSGDDRRRVLDAVCRDAVPPPVVFLLSGLGSQYAGMGAGLYREEEVFRRELDRCAEALAPHLGRDLRELLFPGGADAAAARREGAGLDLKAMLGRGGGERDEASRRLDHTVFAQPALFAVEWALARLWISWGVRPESLLGYSLGEYVAAALAGVLRLEDALTLVARRATLIDELPAGAMLGVPLTPERLEPWLAGGEPGSLSLAAVNGPEQSVVAGPPAAVDDLAARLAADGVEHRRLPTTHAFHSAMMAPIRDALGELVAGFELRPPQVPYLSNVTGTWITDEQATDAGYWSEHACRPVLFAPAVAELAADPLRVLLEIGPGQTLLSLATQCAAGSGEAALRGVASLPGDFERRADGAHAATALGKLWLLGCEPDWQRYGGGRGRRRVPLPTYPFERRRFWAGPDAASGAASGLAPQIAAAERPAASLAATNGHATAKPATRFHLPTWKRAPALPARGSDALAAAPRHWLLLDPGDGRLEPLAERLEALGHPVTRVVPAAAPTAGPPGPPRRTLDPAADGAFTALFADLSARSERPPLAVIHGWSLTDGAGGAGDDPRHTVELGYASLRRLAAAFTAAADTDIAAAGLDLWVLAQGVYDVTGGETLSPLGATLLGPCQTLPLEHPGLACRVIELAAGAAPPAERLLAEIAGAGSEQVVALRGGHRWLPVLDGVEVADGAAAPAAVAASGAEGGLDGRSPADGAARPEGAWLVLGGSDGEGRRFAELLVRSGRRRLVLVEPEAAATQEAVAVLGELGAEVEVATAAGAASMAAAVATARRRFGTVAGVVVAPTALRAAASPAAGRAEDDRAEDDRGEDDRAAAEPPTADPAPASFAALAADLGALDAALAGEATEARLLVSSLAGPGSGDGFAGLAESFARNLLFDTFAHAAAAGAGSAAPPWISLSWDLWPESGDGATSDGSAAGLAAFRALLAAQPAPQVLVSARPLARSWNRLPGGGAQGAAPRPPGERHPRPELKVEFVAPRNEVETTIAGVWQELLGVDRVGVLDNFLDLGGDSLLASRLAARLSAALGLDLPVRVFFEAATVEELAQVVEERRAAGEAEELESLYARLATMSDEDVLRELEKRNDGPGPRGDGARTPDDSTVSVPGDGPR